MKHLEKMQKYLNTAHFKVYNLKTIPWQDLRLPTTIKNSSTSIKTSVFTVQSMHMQQSRVRPSVQHKSIKMQADANNATP